MISKTPSSFLWKPMFRIGLFCCFTILATLSLGYGQSLSEQVLYSGSGDGDARFAIDEFGGSRTGPGRGIRFNPLGGFIDRQADYITALYIFDYAGTNRTIMTSRRWPYYSSCPNNGEAKPSISNLIADTLHGTTTRITRFTVPEFPDLEVRLEQNACGGTLYQRYSITNTGTATASLKLVRVADMDMYWTAGYTRNYGAEYPIGSANPVGAMVLDFGATAGVAVTAPADGDAVFEGWRVQVGGSGDYGHAQTWGSYGFANIPWPGVNGDGLNGYWTNPRAGSGFCRVDVTDVPLADNFANYYGVYPARDVSVMIQSRLDIPAGATRDYVTETIGVPGGSCCVSSSSCGIVTGSVKVDDGTCTGTDPVPGQVIALVEQTTGETFYAVTDQNGVYSISAPFGDYVTTFGPYSPPGTSCGDSINVVLDTVSPSVSGVNFNVNSSCSLDMFIVGRFQGNTLPDECGIPPSNPCPGDTYSYCFNLINNGTRPVLPGTNMQYMFFGGLSITNPIPVAGTGCPKISVTGTAGGSMGSADLVSVLNPGEGCEFCIGVDVAVTPTPTLRQALIFNSGPFDCDPSGDWGGQAFVADPDDCSCDPNIMDNYPLGCGPNHNIGREEITYHIRFHNIGTGIAKRVEVRDTLDTDLDVSSFHLIHSNHQITDLRVNPVAGSPGQFALQFIYENINLLPITTDPNAEGLIVYRMAPKAGIPDGSRIDNYAAIYFDNNPPVVTNTAFNTIKDEPLPSVTGVSGLVAYKGYAPGECVVIRPMVMGGTPPYSFAWETGETTDTLEVCPDSSSLYRLEVTDSEGCSDIVEVEVEVIDVTCASGKSKSKSKSKSRSKSKSKSKSKGSESKVIMCHKAGTSKAHEHCVKAKDVAKKLDKSKSAWMLGPCKSSSAKMNELHGEDMEPSATEMLLSAYPNPFQGSTTIEFTVNDPAVLTFDVYDLNGVRIERMFHGPVVPGQVNSLSFGGDHVPDGIYFGVLRSSDGQVKTLKLIQIE